MAKETYDSLPSLISAVPRYTIQQKHATIYFELIEHRDGAWVTAANHDALVKKLETRIQQLEAQAVRINQPWWKDNEA